MSNSMHLERDIYARLYNPQTDQFTGGISDIAYSRGITPDHHKRIGSLILGLDSTTTDSEVFGFYGIGKGEFVAVHSHVMSKAEDTNRGAPIFSEYILVTGEQLRLLDWNIAAVFELFPQGAEHLQFTEKTRDLEPYVIEPKDKRNYSWYPDLRSNWLRVEAVISSYLASERKIHIISGYQEPRERQRFLSSLVKAFPLQFGDTISFSTYLGKSSNLSAKIFFSSTRESYSGFHIVDWTAAKVSSDSSGGLYAHWVSNLIQTTRDPKDFRKTITDLHLSKEGRKYKTMGEELDASVGLAGSPLLEKSPISSREKLGLYIKDLNKYEPLLTDEEVADRLSYVLNCVMEYSAYDDGFAALSFHRRVFHENDFQEQIAERIVNQVFATPIRDQNLDLLSDFIKQLTEHGSRTQQPELQSLCQRIMTFALQQRNYRPGIQLWSKLEGLSWATSDIWFETALREIDILTVPKDLALIVESIGCPPSQLAFDALLKLLERSSLISRLPETTSLLRNYRHLDAGAFGKQTLQSYKEIKSPAWLKTLLIFGHKHILGFTATLPEFLNEIGASYTHSFLEYVIGQNNELLIALVSFSIICNEVQKHESRPVLMSHMIKLLGECSPQYIDVGLEILQGHWQQFDNNQLEAILTLLNKSPQAYRTIYTSMTVIRGLLQRRSRILDIQDAFKKIKRDETDSIVQKFTRDFLYSGDVDAWVELEKIVQDRRLVKEYRWCLVRTLLQDHFFHIEDSKLWRISVALDAVGLRYEADVLVYWLFFRRVFFLNPIQTIQRTLDGTGVDVSQAARIIGSDNVFNRKYGHSLALLILGSNRSTSSRLDVDRLVKELDEFLSIRTTSSVGNRLKLFVSDITTDMIWVEICNLLSQSLKSEIKKKQKGKG